MASKSIAKRPNGKFRARYRDPSGREHAKHFTRKKDAETWLDEQTAALVTGQYVSPDAGKVTFKAYAEEWRRVQVHRLSSAEHVERMLRRHAYPAFGDKPLSTIRPSEVQAWVKGMSLTLAPSTVAVAHGIVAGVFKAAIRDKRITSSPCEGTKLPEDHRTEVVPLSRETVAAIEAAMPPRYRALVTLAAATGLRQGEVCGLTVDLSGLRPPSPKPIVRVDRQLVTITGHAPFLGPPKRKASRREIPLPRVGVEALAAHLAAFPPVEQEVTVRDAAGRTITETVEFVFTTETGKPIRRNKLQAVFAKAVRDARAPTGTSFHALRHFYASLLIRHGESVKVVQRRLGHATAAETLDTYSHLWPDSEDRTRDAVDSVLGAPADSVRTGVAH